MVLQLYHKHPHSSLAKMQSARVSDVARTSSTAFPCLFLTKIQPCLFILLMS